MASRNQDPSSGVAPSSPPGPQQARPERPAVTIAGSRLFTHWLAGTGGSLVFTTHDAGKIFFVGIGSDGRLAVVERSFPRPMGLGIGLGADGRAASVWMAALAQLWRFEAFREPAGSTAQAHDALFVPITGHTTGDIDIHDIHEDTTGRPVFVATRFNCLATIDGRSSFVPLWRPPWIDRLAAEDRCHLNGLAMEGGRAAWVTAVGQGNIAESWRQHRRSGGVVVDVARGEIAVRGLSMPHSPRIYEGRLWLTQAGTGELGWIDTSLGRFEPLAFLPGFARGLTFAGGHAVVGLSRPREGSGIDDLVLGERLAEAGMAPVTGLAVIDLATGDIVHKLMIEGAVREIYDVGFLPGVIRPGALGFRTDEIRFAIRPGAPGTLNPQS